MPLPIASLLHVEYHLRGVSADLPEHEQQRMIALTAINHLGNFGHLLSRLSASKPYCSHDPAPVDAETNGEQLDGGLYVLGELQACIADTAYTAVEEMFGALTEKKNSKAA